VRDQKGKELKGVGAIRSTHTHTNSLTLSRSLRPISLSYSPLSLSSNLQRSQSLSLSYSPSSLSISNSALSLSLEYNRNQGRIWNSVPSEARKGRRSGRFYFSAKIPTRRSSLSVSIHNQGRNQASFNRKKVIPSLHV
jgi:outer membrane usher protein FimD/PapC